MIKGAIIVELNKIYNQNCTQFIKQIEDNSIDLIIADPPYNKGVANWDKFSMDEYNKFITNFIIEAKRILSNKGNLFIYNQQPMAGLIFPNLYNNLYYVDEIIWYYKNGGGNSKNKCKNSHQLLYWFSKSKEYINNFDLVRQPYSGTRSKYKKNIDKNPKKVWVPNENGAKLTNVWEISIVRQTESTILSKIGIQKPLKICDNIIKLGSNNNSIIYIPFAGSGSEIESCIRNNRKWIATEINKDYIENVIKPRILNIR